MPSAMRTLLFYALKRILNVSDSLQIEFADQQDFFQTPSLDLSDPWQRPCCSAPNCTHWTRVSRAAQSEHKAAVSRVFADISIRWLLE